MITMPHIFLSRGGTAGEDSLQGFDENYWQDDGAGAPLKRSFIHLMAVGRASRAAKICDTPGSSTNITWTPCLHSGFGKTLRDLRIHRRIGGALSDEDRCSGRSLTWRVAYHDPFPGSVLDGSNLRNVLVCNGFSLFSRASNWAIDVRQPRAVSLKAGITAGSTMVAGETFYSLVQESNAIAIKSCSVASSSSNRSTR